MQRRAVSQRACGAIREIPMRRVMVIAFIIALASIGPNIFPAAQAGYGSLHSFALELLLPSLALLVLVIFFVRRPLPDIAVSVVWGALAGALATIPLEIIRWTGFHFGYMPGNLPQLMGVLLLDRFAEGPSLSSNIAGWAYHFWNGAAFGIIYVLVFGTKRWTGILYGIVIGIVFMISPVVTSLGIGLFGLQFSYGFPITVIMAHVAFGAALEHLANWSLGTRPSLLFKSIASCLIPSARANSEAVRLQQ
jgi:hypothetical protein